MPIYEYQCSSCQKLSDVLQKLDDPPPASCPSCGAEGTLSRVVSRTSFVLKGGGWSADLYGSKKSSEPAASPSGEAKATDGKPAAPAPASEGSTGSTAAAPAKPDKPAGS